MVCKINYEYKYCILHHRSHRPGSHRCRINKMKIDAQMREVRCVAEPLDTWNECTASLLHIPFINILHTIYRTNAFNLCRLIRQHVSQNRIGMVSFRMNWKWMEDTGYSANQIIIKGAQHTWTARPIRMPSHMDGHSQAMMNITNATNSLILYQI